MAKGEVKYPNYKTQGAPKRNGLRNKRRAALQKITIAKNRKRRERERRMESFDSGPRSYRND